ncbi:polyadenylate-binding protein RBP47-like [Salvia splendens]|uniref:polyadenylate-binding protein RBP47-like n=1 Tax=Salvia splendens TaxID=180675 RepID=UPI001C26C4EE|nr:polyadenylate-binding protein RBP47-like [Salvia splendens]
MNGGDMNQSQNNNQQQQQQMQQHQQWMAMQQYQQQWMAMQYPAMAMQQHMMYNQHYVPYYHPQQQPQPTQGQKHGNQIQNGAEDNKRSGLEISSRGWTKVISSRAFLNLERLSQSR